MPKYLVVGGGIAAVQCVEELARLCPNDAVTLVSATSRIKASTEMARHRIQQALQFELNRLTGLLGLRTLACRTRMSVK